MHPPPSLHPLQALQEAHTLDGARIFVETGISLMLALPRPRHPPTYYGLLLLDLSKLLSGVPPLLEAALNALYAHLPQLDAELQLRLADWLGDDTPLACHTSLAVAFAPRRQAQ